MCAWWFMLKITGSLENYLQEAGRAGRDQKDAMCVLLFNREDVDAQFGISRLSQLELRDLKAVWRKISQLRQRHADDEALIVSGGEILKDTDEHMSFDSDDRQADTKIKTALAWLERSDLLVRTENQTRIFPSRSGRLTGTGIGQARSGSVGAAEAGVIPNHTRIGLPDQRR